MKIQIRRGVFETNSSSTHSITICTQDEYNKWIKGEVYLTSSGEFVSKEEVFKYVQKNEDELFEAGKIDIKFETLSEEDKNTIIYEYNYYTPETFESEYLENFEEFYTTPSGDKIVAFGKYGYDG